MASDMNNPGDRPFTVVLKGPSAIRIPFGKGALFALEDARMEIRVLTRWVESGSNHPLPRELYFEVRLYAKSIDAAIEEARVLSSVATPVISFATNAEVGSIEPHVAFETTPGIVEREFVEYFNPDERGHIAASRGADPDVIAETLKAVMGSSHPKGIMNALAHYHSALGYYHLGGESLSVGHLFMAAEALKYAVLNSYCAAEGVTKDDLVSSLNLDRRGDLLAWARRELVFHGDVATHRDARDASDWLEHGYRSIGEVRQAAEAVCDAAFGHLREAIVSLLDVPDRIERALLDRFGLPHDSKSTRRRITGILVGESEDLAAEGENYPLVEWNSSIRHFDIPDNGKPSLTLTDHFTMRISDSVGMQLKSAEMHGRVRPGTEVDQLDIQVLPPD